MHTHLCRYEHVCMHALCISINMLKHCSNYLFIYDFTNVCEIKPYKSSFLDWLLI